MLEILSPEFLKGVSPDTLSGMSNKELLTLHDELHKAWGGSLNLEDMINYHVFIQEELERRELPHIIEDELDKKSAALAESNRAQPKILIEYLEGGLGGTIPPITQIQAPFVEVKEPTHEEERELSSEISDNPYYVEQPKNRTSKFMVQRHLRGIWVEKEREEILSALKKVSGEDLKKLWRDSNCEYLIKPLTEWQGSLQAADEAEEDVTAVMNKHLSKELPSSIEWSKIVNRGSTHQDLRMLVPNGKSLIGITLTSPRLVLQFLETGELVFPLRDKLLEWKEGDKILATQKARQPVGWLDIVTPTNKVYEAPAGELGATSESGGRFLFIASGKAIFGIIKDSYVEHFYIFDAPYEGLTGRYGLQLLESNSAYLKVPGAKWWMFDRAYSELSPYILTHGREAVESKASKEGLTKMVYNPELLWVLWNNPSWRKKFLPNVSVEDVRKAYDKYITKGAGWGKAK